jgi:hypothetical protein
LAGHAETCWAGRPKLLDFNVSGNSLPGCITLRAPQGEKPFMPKNDFFDSLKRRGHPWPRRFYTFKLFLGNTTQRPIQPFAIDSLSKCI